MTRCFVLGGTLLLVTACAQQEVDRARLKEELKQEILAELAAEAELAPSPDAPGKPKESSGTQPTTLPTGNVVGKTLLGKRGLPGCRVRLIRLDGSGGVLGLFSSYREGTVFDVVTGRDGTYEFKGVPVGAYRLKWLPQGETGWIRRLATEPDVVVEEGQTTGARDFRAGHPLLKS